MFWTYGGSRFRRIPTASSSPSSNARCSALLVASKIISTRSLVWKGLNGHQIILEGSEATFAALMTWRPLPLPSLAPSIIPGRSSTWISAPPYSRTPGIAVRVVKEYAATSLLVLVILERKVDFPTEGNPTKAIRASPLLLTSNPLPPPDPAPGAGSRS